MKEKNITVRKTARYFTIGETDDNIESIWFICHGYGHLANYFLRNFEVLNNGKNFLVGPEGLHRFYLKGYTDRVGASWMTKEDRLNDIRDYTNFLDDLYIEIVSLFKDRPVKINVLGFSQGAATVCRWLSNKKATADNLILWAGAFPNDLPVEACKDLLNSLNLFLVIGDEDEFISAEQVEEQENRLRKSNVSYKLIKFKGKHEINNEVLKMLAGQI